VNAVMGINEYTWTCQSDIASLSDVRKVYGIYVELLMCVGKIRGVLGISDLLLLLNKVYFHVAQ
jgi:hypothetical protein